MNYHHHPAFDPMTFSDMPLRGSLVSRADCPYIFLKRSMRLLSNFAHTLAYISADNGSFEKQTWGRKTAIFWVDWGMAYLLGLVRPISFSAVTRHCWGAFTL